MTFAATPEISLIVNPWYEYSAIGQSNNYFFQAPDEKGVITDYVGHEPTSRTRQYGSEFLMGIVF